MMPWDIASIVLRAKDPLCGWFLIPGLVGGGPMYMRCE